MLRRHLQLRMQIHQLLDASLFAMSLWLAHLLRSHWKIEILGGASQITSFDNFIWLYLLIVPLAPLVLESQGFYSRPLLPARGETAWILLKGSAICVLSCIFAIWLFKAQPQISRSVIFLFGAIAFVLVYLKEELVRLGIHIDFASSQIQKRVVLMGTAEDTIKLKMELKKNQSDGIKVLAEFDLNKISIEEFVEFLHEHAVNGVIVNARHTIFGLVEKAIQACELEGVEVWLMADFFKTTISRTSLDDFHGKPVLIFRSTPETSWQALSKQALDLAGSFILLVVLSPILVAVMLAVKLTSPGPIFFRQKRSGLNGKPFVMYKFRSMVTDAEQRKQELEQFNEMTGPVFKVTNDPRITRFGKWLRKTSLDEFPQLFNVLKGDMSLVGPRPLPVDEVKRFDDFAHRRRLSVKPGLTCLWQIKGRNNVYDFKEWVRLDLEYIDTWSFWLDVKILWMTVPVVLFAKGAK
ncbi:MAG: exopolysaccharide biosynthesis polyprenyl glycosylphosphotransferase [Verrucomicrobiales bacterium]|nr:exopolysaccharide biosynthesis polyprenyl glycosylphosphotransferase [Verrucomicrobiales bacterium]